MAALCALAIPAFAIPITYTYEGVGTGTLGEQQFTGAAFTFTAQADTDNITPWASASGGPQNTHLSATLDIAGIGLFTVLTPSHTWLSQNCCGGLGANLSANWIQIDAAAFTSAGYGLNTDFGPVVDNTPQHISQFNDVSTSGGNLTFTSMSTVTFTASTSDLSQVPEPSTFAMLAISAGVLLVRGRRKTRIV